MTARPTSQLNWGGAVVEPTAPQKAAGFSAGDRPPAQWKNWELQTTDLWQKYLDSIAADVLTAGGFTLGESDSFSRHLALRQEVGALLQPQFSADLGGPHNAFATNGSRIVAVGDAGQIRTSDDLVRTWTNRTAAGGYVGNFQAATYANSLFVIAGDSGELQTSPDGVTWTQRTSGFGGDDIRQLVQRAGVVVAVGENGAWTRSTDSINYTGGTVLVGAGFTISDVAHTILTTSIFVAIGSGGGSTRANFVHRSTTDGASWSAVDLTAVLGVNEVPRGIEWSSKHGFVIGVYDLVLLKYTATLTSTDGLTWTRNTNIAAQNISSTGTLVTTTGGVFLVSHSSGVPTLYSLDASTWRTLPVPVSPSAGGVNSVRVLSLASARMWIGNADSGTGGRVWASPPWVY